MRTSVALTQDLVRFRTINPPGDERACAEQLAALLERAGFAVEVMPFGEGRAQLVARIGGTTDKLPLGFTGHLDTVPLGAQPWSVDPLAADIIDGKLYGRGSSDMKSGVATFVTACVALADRLAGTAGVGRLSPPARKRVAPAPRPWFGPRPLFLRSVRLLWPNPPATVLWWVTREPYIEAVTTGSPHTAPCLKRCQRGSQGGARRHGLCRISISISPGRCSWRPTLNVGTIHGGLNINSVPDRAAIGLDIRTIPGQSHAKICPQLASYLGAEVKLSTLLDAEAFGPDRMIHGWARYSG